MLLSTTSQQVKVSAVKYWWGNRCDPKRPSRSMPFWSMYHTARGLPAPLPQAEPRTSALVSLWMDALLSHSAFSPSFLPHFATRMSKPATSWTQIGLNWRAFLGGKCWKGDWKYNWMKVACVAICRLETGPWAQVCLQLPCYLLGSTCVIVFPSRSVDLWRTPVK